MVGALITIVDDDPFIATSLTRMLQAQGCRVSSCGTIEEAWSMLKMEPPDVLILDLSLPDGDGIDLCRRIRSRWQYPILMLSSRGESMDKVTGFEVGADDYMAKPFDPHELLARVRALFRRSRLPIHQEVAPNLQSGRLFINQQKREARFGSSPLVLTKTEYALLVYLVGHLDQVVTRAQLFQAVWGYSMDSSSNTLDVLLYRLRAKLKSAGVGDPIVTVRGHGFKMVPISDGAK